MRMAVLTFALRTSPRRYIFDKILTSSLFSGIGDSIHLKNLLLPFSVIE